MRQAKTQARVLRAPEVVLNLWAYADEEGYIIRIAGKAYVMDGDDAEKLTLLRHLSATDFLSAPWQKVPQNFTVDNADGQTMLGVAHASLVGDPNAQEPLFGPLMDSLAKSLPDQLRNLHGDYSRFRLELSNSPLCVTTVVMEYPSSTVNPVSH
ncbi:hypothetical protein [Accumulibacter sp.]|jgi:hypothetical protein|uniref:hypothetical protein n=1 Tax=Accumulibacter sp. TaxID=2053492 RepID=UPI00263603CA|nr:hypothetical protein [Accumulibacter sp.]